METRLQTMNVLATIQQHKVMLKVVANENNMKNYNILMDATNSVNDVVFVRMNIYQVKAQHIQFYSIMSDFIKTIVTFNGETQICQKQLRFVAE